MKLRVAEINIELQSCEEYTKRISEKYLADFSVPDLIVSATKEEINKELSLCPQVADNGIAEATALYRKIGGELPEFDAFILHAAAFTLRDRGIAFLAKSGTGKSTHMLNWKKHFGDELNIINGDKPIVRIKNSTPYIYGTPWCGKEGFSENLGAKLTDLCFIVRGEENSAVKIEDSNIIKRLLNQVMIPVGSKNIIKTLELINQMVKECNIWEVRCTSDIDSAEISSKKILGVK